MADAANVFKGIDKKPNVGYPVLVPNMKGLEQALEAGVREISIFTAASEAFCKKNINCTIVTNYCICIFTIYIQIQVK